MTPQDWNDLFAIGGCLLIVVVCVAVIWRGSDDDYVDL